MDTKTTQRDQHNPTQPLTSDQATTSHGDQNITLVGNAVADEHNDIIGFESAGKTLNSQSVGPKEIDLLLSSLKSDEKAHEIKDFLARPTKIGHGMITPEYKEIAFVSVLDALLSNENFALARRKLDGFYGMKMTAHLKLTLNVEPFQSGILLLYFVPGSAFIYRQQGPNTGEENNLPFDTGCPHVIINLATQTEATLSIPYVGLLPFVDLTRMNVNTRPTDFGYFKLKSMIPIRDSTSAPTAEYSWYMYFTDVELFGATYNNFSAQMNNRPAQEHQRAQELDLSSLAEVAEKVGPLLAALSRPTEDQGVKRIQVAPVGSTVVTNARDASLKMSVDANQAVTVSQLGISTNDDMDIRNFVSQPGYLQSFEWNTTQDEGSLLFQTRVEPQASMTSLHPGEPAVQIVYPNRLRYLSNMFQYWRGALRYTFSIAATKFHSGRLRFVYTLGGYSDSALYPSVRSYTYIVDVRDGYQFTLELPYIAPQPWKFIPQYWKGTQYVTRDEVDETLHADTHATLQCFVENELRAPPTTSDTIGIAVLVAGGDDFQVSVPIWPTSIPQAKSDNNGLEFELPSALKNKQPKDKFLTQGLIEDDRHIIDITTGARPLNKRKALPSEVTMGETIDNLRTLLRRYYPIDMFEIDNTSTSDNDQKSEVLYHYFNPYEFRIRGYYKNDVSRCPDPLMYLMGCFGFYRGGLRFIFQPTTQEKDFTVVFNPTNAKMALEQEVEVSGLGFIPLRSAKFVLNNSTIWDVLNYMPRIASQPFDTTVSGMVNIEVPFYNRVDKSYCGWYSPENKDFDKFRALLYAPDGQLLLNFPVKTKNSLRIFRSTADDFNMGYALGPPPTAVNCWCSSDITVGK